MYEKARAASVPMDTIERAIKRGTGELEGVRYEAVTYEGYAPDGVAVIVECLTDNRNRTAAEIRNIFSRNGGSTAEPGAVSWQFERKGVITLPKSLSEEEIMEVALEEGGEDLVDQGDHWMLVCTPSSLTSLEAALDRAGLAKDSAEISMVPTTTIEITDPTEAKKVLKLLEALDEHDDVQNIHSNFDIPDEVLALAE
jgi:YebC/PmpR family DNA-binding regulatory protein